MQLPFFNVKRKWPGQLVAVDLGSRKIKAVLLQRRDNSIGFLNFTIQDAPIFEKSLSVEILAEHLKGVMAALGTKVKHVALLIGVNDSILRVTEMPAVPVEDMRLMLKYNCKAYLQQDLPDYVYDCHILSATTWQPPEAGRATAKTRVLVTGARKQTVADLTMAGTAAGLIVTEISPCQIGPVNALEFAQREAVAKGVVAVVDIGFKNSSISILMDGELAMNRVVGMGGDRLTAGLAEAMSISYAEAEGMKVVLPESAQPTMAMLLAPLGRELRASIDFFEHQHDKSLSQVYITGGSARSEFFIQSLQSEIMAPCKTWNPASFLEWSLAPQQWAEVEQVAPQLSAPIGACAAALQTSRA